jgi:uncharacterized protein YggU (UPF0235/DUF167 family)
MIITHVTTGAKTTRQERLSEDTWRIWTTKKPHNNEANIHIRQILAKELNIGPTKIFLRSGEKSRKKIWEIQH